MLKPAFCSADNTVKEVTGMPICFILNKQSYAANHMCAARVWILERQRSRIVASPAIGEARV